MPGNGDEETSPDTWLTCLHSNRLLQQPCRASLALQEDAPAELFIFLMLLGEKWLCNSSVCLSWSKQCKTEPFELLVTQITDKCSSRTVLWNCVLKEMAVSVSMGSHIYCHSQNISLERICQHYHQQSKCVALATGIFSMNQRSNLMPKL